jgi:hypothetical protein
MIDLKKQYRTQGGYKVKLNFIDGETVYGHFEHLKDFWGGGEWNINDGIYSKTGDSECDLVEAKPRIKHTVWINVYKNFISNHPTKEFADFHDHSYGRADFYDRGGSRLACVKVELDVQEGEGL